MSLNVDNAEYWKFTGPMRLDKELHTLGGLLSGVEIDGEISTEEFAAVRRWMLQHSKFRNRHPFDEIYDALDESLADGVLDAEEVYDVLWLCDSLTHDQRYFNFVTSDMQRLQGILGGILADGEITEYELRGLQDWLAEHEHLRRCWPYDEVEAIVVSVLADGKLESHEQSTLKAFFSQFLKTWDRKVIDIPDEWRTCKIDGVCAVCPEVEFSEQIFCFTGKSKRATRAGIQELVIDRGGRFSKTVVKDTDYLIVGADGNPCWAFACYGRKVERAIELRQDGKQILLVHENDFWDAVQDG